MTAAAKAEEGRKERPPGRDDKGRFTSEGNKGRPPGTKNKVTVAQVEAARQLFTPIALAALEKGNKHIESCSMVDCDLCKWIVPTAWHYAFGKPTQRIEFTPDDFAQKLREDRPDLDDDKVTYITERARQYAEGAV